MPGPLIINMNDKPMSWSALKRVKSNKIITIVGWGLCLLFGLFLLGKSIYDKAEAEDACANWVETPCELVSVDVETTEKTSGKRRKHTRSVSEIVISYRYTYQGRELRGDRYSVPDQSGEPAVYRELARSIKNSKKHHCYVNPKSQSDPELLTVEYCGKRITSCTVDFPLFRSWSSTRFRSCLHRGIMVYALPLQQFIHAI